MTNAPTPRETADHAELARLAEAAEPYWHAANLACGGNPIAVDLVAPFVGAMSPAVCSAILSEIAALRASASVIEPELGDLEATNADLSQRLTQAERQRDELRKALEFYAQPIWSIRGEFPEASPHSEYRPDCGDTARQALANQGADQ